MAQSKAPGELLREARKRAKKTQEEIATETGVSQPCVAKWENGDTTPRDLSLVAKAYRVSATRLFAACAAFVAERRKAAA
jgi:transcriptional regulator with XRE-family HTH domain